MASPAGPESPTFQQRIQQLGAEARRRWRQAKRNVEQKLTWSWIYRTTSYARSALWIVPFIAIAAVFVTVPILRMLDAWLGWVPDLGLEGTHSLYDTVITLNLSFLVFTFGSLLVAIQIAGGQLTPRVIATTLLRDNVVRYSVGLFVFTLIFTVRALNRLAQIEHQLVTFVTGLLGIGSVVMFLFLIDYAARLLRPVSIVAKVAEEGLQVLRSVYQELPEGGSDSPAEERVIDEASKRVVDHDGFSEIVLAIDLRALLRQARKTRGVVEFVPHVGDFVATGDPLFVLYGGAAAIDDRSLRAAVAFGTERTMEQDPLFSFRIMVDIALKALSPAINDPTTAVLAIDQIHRLLRFAGRRRLHGGPILDGLGKPRVLYRTPSWDDFVHLSCTEIRACGANNVQVARRLRALLENLTATLPRYRQAALQAERARLDLAIKAAYPIPDDLALASIPDMQGLGGSRGTRRVN
jgi:uncharacterized membrane protein